MFSPNIGSVDFGTLDHLFPNDQGQVFIAVKYLKFRSTVIVIKTKISNFTVNYNS